MTTEELNFMIEKIDTDWIEDNPYETYLIVNQLLNDRLFVEATKFSFDLLKKLNEENEYWKEEADYWKNKYKRMKEDEVHNAE